MNKINKSTDDAVVISCHLIDRLIRDEGKDWPNLIALYIFYYNAARRQKTDCPWAVNKFVAQGLHWGERQVKERKARLISLGLIKNVRRVAKDGKVSKWYVRVNYIWNQSTSTPEVQVETPTTCTFSHPVVSDCQMLEVPKEKCLKSEKEKEREGKIHTSDKTTTSTVGIVSEANNGVGVSVASTGVVLDVGRSFSVSEANTVPLLNESAAKLADAHKAADNLYRDAFGTKAKEARICDEVYLQAKYGRLDIFRHCQMLLDLSPSGLESYKAYIHYAIEFKRLNGSYPIRPDLKIITQHTITDTPAATVARLAVSYAQTGKSWDWFGDYMRNAIAAAAGCGTGPGERYDSEDAGEAMWQRIKASMAAQAAQAKAGV